MIKTKLTTIGLVLLLGATQSMAETKPNKSCCLPTPVGGIESLQRHATYPIYDRQVGNEADVVLKFHVNMNGEVSNVQVVRSGGYMFDNSAIMAVHRTRWNPAMQNGNPVPVTFELPFEFRAE